MITSLIEFDDASEHTFDPLKIVLLNDKGQLKDTSDPAEILFANFDGLGGGEQPPIPETPKRGAPVGVFGGPENTGQIANGKLEFPNVDKSDFTYAGLNIAGNFSIRFKVSMNVPTITTNKQLVNLDQNGGNSLLRIYVGNQGGGITRLWYQLVSSTGANLANLILTTFNFATTPDFEVVFSVDVSGNAVVHVDGVLKSTVAISTLDFTNADLRLGDAISDAVANFDDLQVIAANAFPLPLSAPYPEPTTYVKTEEIISTPVPMVVDKVFDIDIIHEIPADTELKFIAFINGNPFWFNAVSLAWEPSNITLAQANTEAEIKAQMPVVPIVEGIGAVLQVASILKSTLGYSTPLIESISFEYRSSFKSGNLTMCVVTGTVTDNSGIPIVGATIRVNSTDKFINNVLVGPSAKAITNTQGKFAISIPETTTSGTTVDIQIEYQELKFEDGSEFTDNVVFLLPNKIIPNIPTADLDSLLDG